MARNDAQVLDAISKRLLCSKSKFRAHFTILPIDGQAFIVERAFVEFLQRKNTELRADESRIIIPAGVSL